jgi:predicted Zn-dependent peptidase
MYKHVDSNIGISLMAIEYPFGGSTEIVGERGISHLMEHLMCKMYDDLRQTMRASRIEYNAFTAETKTVFWFEGLDDELKKFSSIFFDRITQHEHIYSKNDFENEKKTVIQEYKDCFNDQRDGSYYNFLRKHYESCDAIGFLNDIENFSY